MVGSSQLESRYGSIIYASNIPMNLTEWTRISCVQISLNEVVSYAIPTCSIANSIKAISEYVVSGFVLS